MTQHYTHDEAPPNKYFHFLPNMYDDDLDPFEYRLIGHYKRVGTSWEGVRKTAEICKMSVGKVTKTRKSLEAKGLIKVQMLTRKDLKDRGLVTDLKPDDKNKICVVTVTDVMEQNTARYKTADPVHHVNTPVHGVNTPVHHVNKRRTIEKEPSVSHAPLLDPFFDAIAAVWNTRATGTVNKIKYMMLGTSSDSEWAECNFEPPANPAEILDFGKWYKRKNPELSIPRKPEKIQRWFYEFRDATAKKITPLDPAHDLSIPVDFEPALLQFLPKAVGDE